MKGKEKMIRGDFISIAVSELQTEGHHFNWKVCESLKFCNQMNAIKGRSNLTKQLWLTLNICSF